MPTGPNKNRSLGTIYFEQKSQFTPYFWQVNTQVLRVLMNLQPHSSQKLAKSVRLSQKTHLQLSFQKKSGKTNKGL